ncbi:MULTISPECIES: FadR/GntR family transcriptional regulator [unclassified Shinella]|uniref:FadR/GntR family transcriptional regulator n=1 Tax=unclassified Shinella TaxID=2643062 RepID=UPI00225D54EC|nr:MULTISPECIES: FadR/GntR family transcriptional regulator [unclassified Shinella]CAI0333910.1 GntR family transcriptional regulator [Rhizobiaceae bacterium]CAK7261553.1 GntR family transcriptional regulator, galactonate operon transcriptional repressor [Shinella sp. WSC3-e]MDC7259744.1 FadR family transcriptional regulator [Shinella sp. YE25]MDC7267085.1 FadR family transcriptional regulator [Shinella sp. HY16]MDC7273982.1 FadR family transcriptional regulator [Shinella sp. YZ44]
MPFSSIAVRETGASAIARQIGTAILRGEHAPGATLPGELELAVQFGASRNIVREAIKVLAGKGLVESRKKAGTRVRYRADWQMLDRELLAWRLEGGTEIGFATDLLALREAIEPAAAAAAARHQDKEAIQAIRTAFSGMVAAGTDRKRFAGPDLQFHKAILAASGNEFMMAFGGMIEAALAAFIGISLRHREAPGPSIPMHEAVLLAVEAGDPERAHTAMLALLARTRTNIEKDATR